MLFTALSKFGVSIESDLFEGTLTSTLRCLKCGHRSTRDEAFCDLGVDVDGRCSLEDALKAYTEWETLDGDNMWRCDVCAERVPALKGVRPSRLPPLLMLQLKR